ncbi:MAG: MFS transporter [Bacteroidales bacterium]|nr:MFS transporter [Bacteroidales bacterium]
MAKARLFEKIGYGFGDFASSMFWKIFSYYLPIFYSDVFGLKPAHAATLLLVTKLYDAISDPLMGIIADRTDTKWGKYRPYLLWIAIPFALIGVFSFYVPESTYTVKHVYAYVMYILMMTVYTAINVPYGAMLGVVTADSREKSVFSSFRMFFAYIGSFVAMGIFWIFEKMVIGQPIVRDGVAKLDESGNAVLAKGVGDASPGQWTMTVAIVASLCAILFILSFLMTREHVKVEKKAEAKSSIGSDLKALVSNGPWWLLLGAAIGQLLCGSIRGGVATYYFANILGTNIFLTCAVYLTIGEIGQMVGVAFAVPFSEKFGKRNTFIGSLVAVIVFSSLIWFIPVGTSAGLWMLIALQVLVSLAFGVAAPLTWSMFADVADYSELKNGSASTGLIFSSSSMAQKFGGAIGGWLLLTILGVFGYNKDLAVQAPETLTAIKALMSYIPAIGAVISIGFLSFYPLTPKRMKGIQAELAARRGTESAE